MSQPPFHYKTNGADWGEVYPACNGKNQSPIPLYSQGNEKFNYDVIKSDQCKFEYTNQKNLQVDWLGFSTFDKETAGTNTFESKLAADLFGADTKFSVAQFHFHVGAEHTVDDKRYDLEMHSVHLPTEKKNDMFAAVVGVMFSVNEANIELTWAEQTIIDNFFESLQLDTSEASVKAAFVAYGDLMNLVNKNRRWVYKGSLTTPPCTAGVYWNVLTTVYPIKQKYLDMFEKQLGKNGHGDCYPTGTYRVLQKIDDHNVKFVEGKTD